MWGEVVVVGLALFLNRLGLSLLLLLQQALLSLFNPGQLQLKFFLLTMMVFVEMEEGL